MSDRDANEVLNYLKGIPSQAPMWLLLLEAGGNDPLRAQEIEDRLTAYWWERWMVYRKAAGMASREQSRKARRSGRG